MSVECTDSLLWVRMRHHLLILCVCFCVFTNKLRRNHWDSPNRVWSTLFVRRRLVGLVACGSRFHTVIIVCLRHSDRECVCFGGKTELQSGSGKLWTWLWKNHRQIARLPKMGCKAQIVCVLVFFIVCTYPCLEFGFEISRTIILESFWRIIVLRSRQSRQNYVLTLPG